MREALPRAHGRVVVAAAAGASGRGWGVLLHPMADAETTAQMSKIRSMAAFLVMVLI
jgi:hypothetical protein